MGHTARRDSRKHCAAIERDSPKRDLDSVVVAGLDARVGSNRVEMQAVLDELHVVVREADASRIHERAFPVRPQPLQVNMATGKDVGPRRSEQPPELVVVDVRQDDVVVGDRRSMEGEKLAPAERHLECRLERLDVREAFRADLFSCPLTDVELSLVWFFHAGGGVEQECIGIAENDRTAETAQKVDHLARLAPALHEVTEADDLIDRIALEVGDNGLECDRVTVDVRDQGSADARRLRPRVRSMR
jgi:hypothetical protein